MIKKTVRDGVDQIDGFLLRVFVAVLEERSVSLAAIRLNLPQPTVSAALMRLRRVVGDPLVTRGRHGMVPTERAEAILLQARSLLVEFEKMCRHGEDDGGVASRHLFSIGTLDYVGPTFVPMVVSEVLQASPLASVQVHQLSVGYDYMEALENGPLDFVIGSWSDPAPKLRHLNLFSDEIVCLVRKGHPFMQEGFDQAAYLNAEHVCPVPYHVDRLGAIDSHLARLGLKRNIRVVLPTFNGIANLVANSDLVFTTGRGFAQGHARDLSLSVLPAPIQFPTIDFRLLWHERSQLASEHQRVRTKISRKLRQYFQSISADTGDRPCT